jgi:hypothetical protein
MNNAPLHLGQRVQVFDPDSNTNADGKVIAFYDEKPYWVDTDTPGAYVGDPTDRYWYTVELLDGGHTEINGNDLKAYYKGVSA